MSIEQEHTDATNFEGVFSKDVVEFVTVASEYCGFVEKATNFSPKTFIDKTLKLLPLLYLKTRLLPDFENVFDAVNEKFVSEADWRLIQENVAQALSTHDSFFELETPVMQESDGSTSLSISECFADIFQDLKNFLMIYQIGTPESMNDALWECKLNFETIWGPRLLLIIKELHLVFYNPDAIDNPDDDEPLQNTTTPNTEEWIISKRIKDFKSE